MSSEEKYQLVLGQMISGTVPTVNVRQAALLSENAMIYDTRSFEEYSISHLRGAVWVDPESFNPEMFQTVSSDQQILVYCTVGYRSEKVGEKLFNLGFTEVHNLYGGILQWKNKGYEVVNSAGQPTDSIHGYSGTWGQWLTNGIAVYE